MGSFVENLAALQNEAVDTALLATAALKIAQAGELLREAVGLMDEVAGEN